MGTGQASGASPNHGYFFAIRGFTFEQLPLFLQHLISRVSLQLPNGYGLFMQAIEYAGTLTQLLGGADPRTATTKYIRRHDGVC